MTFWVKFETKFRLQSSVFEHYCTVHCTKTDSLVTRQCTVQCIVTYSTFKTLAVMTNTLHTVTNYSQTRSFQFELALPIFVSNMDSKVARANLLSISVVFCLTDF